MKKLFADIDEALWGSSHAPTLPKGWVIDVLLCCVAFIPVGAMITFEVVLGR